jgi:hypothetical protein
MKPVAQEKQIMRITRLSVVCLTVVLSWSAAVAQENRAPLGLARQTSDWGVGEFPASLAIDGNPGNFTATATDDDNAMWEVDLGIETDISSIVLHNRDNCCASRLRDIVVSIHDISFLDDSLIDDLILGIPVEEIADIWDSASYETEVLNLENELGVGVLNQGPEFLTVDLVALTGGPVAGRFVRVLRIADPDLSGSGGAGGVDEVSILSLGEVEVYGEASVECPAQGDTHCEELEVVEIVPPFGSSPGVYEARVLADDDSGDSISYTFFAKKAGQTVFVAGPQFENVATFDLGAGSWTISATVDDGLFCDDVAADATCSEVPVEIENLTGNFALEGIASQSSDYGGTRFPARLAIDGDLGNFTATDTPDENPIWEVDLLEPRDIGSIALYNRVDCCQSRLRDIIVSIHDIPFTEDASVDDRVNGIPIDQIEPVWDSALFESEVLNPENVEGAATLAGPTHLVLEIEELAGAKVSGRYVRVLRISDPDLSGTGGAGNDDEASVLSLGEVKVYGREFCPDEEGDTHCLEITVSNGPADNGPGLYDVEVSAEDDSGDEILYTIIAEREPGVQLISGPSPLNIATFDLSIGTWTISATVDDEPLCDDLAADATCSEVLLEVENVTGNFALDGMAFQSSDFGTGQYPADLAIDGDYENFTATATEDENPIWELDLLQDVAIGSIVLHNRTSCCQSRLRDIIVSIHDIPFTEDASIDDRVNGIPIDEIEPVWDSALFESEVLNPENIEGGGTTAGPAQLEVNVEALAGEKVIGRYVRVLRISDPDLSGAAGAANPADEVSLLSLGEVEVFGGTACVEEEADTHCEVLDVVPPGGGPGDYTATVLADDDSGDAIWYTITATQTAGGDAVLVFGPDRDNTTTFELTAGTWSIGAEVSDHCGPAAGDAVCTPVVVVVEGAGGVPFVRGDADASGGINITDAIFLLGYLFQGTAAPTCLDAADVDGIGANAPNITDAIFLLGYLFQGTGGPPEPAPSSAAYVPGDCGLDPADDDGMGCETFAPCTD